MMKQQSLFGRMLILVLAAAMAAPVLAQRGLPSERERQREETDDAASEVRRVGRNRGNADAQGDEAAGRRADRAPPAATPSPPQSVSQSRQPRQSDGFERRDNARRPDNDRDDVQPRPRGDDRRSVPQRDVAPQAGRGRNDQRGSRDGRGDHDGSQSRGRDGPQSHGRSDDRHRGRLPERDRQRLIVQQRQSVEQYRRVIARNQEIERRRINSLQQQRRTRQFAYQQHYWDRQRQMQARWAARRFDYDNDPYFYTAASYRYQRGGRYYEINRYAADVLEQAIRYGYEEGVRAGEADRYDGWRGGYRDNFAYVDANYGYDGYYVSQVEYNHYFREGFRRGYEDGFGRRYRYGEARNGEYLILASVLDLILGIERF